MPLGNRPLTISGGAAIIRLMDRPISITDTSLRVGAVSYLNSKPLVHGLAEALPRAEIVYDLPSRLADQLAAGELDVALVPIVEYLRQSDFRLVSNACVGCRSQVLSVKLFFRTAPQQVRSLALDEGSRTSAALAQVLLTEALRSSASTRTLADWRQAAGCRCRCRVANRRSCHARVRQRVLRSLGFG